MKKRILPALLALCMVMSLLPMSVFAEDEPGCTCEDCNAPTTCDGNDCKKDVENGTPTAIDCTKEDCIVCNPCDVEGCKTAHSKVDTTAAHTFLCTCQGDCGNDDCCEGEGTYEAEEAEENGLCAKCTPATEECTDEHCVDFGEEHEPGKHHYACACVTHGDEGAGNAYGTCSKETAITYGGLCPDCENASGGVHSTELLPCSKADVEGECVESGNTEFTHDPACIEACTSEADCPATGEHKADCIKDGLDNETIVAKTYNYQFAYPCVCDWNHDDGCAKGEASECPNSVVFKGTVTYYVAVEEEEEEEVTPEEEDGPLANVPDEGNLKEVLQDVLDELDEDAETYLCDACKAVGVANCTGAITCEAQAHKDNCLKQCLDNFGTGCPNAVGVSSAHVVKYRLTYTLTTITDTFTTGEEDEVPTRTTSTAAAVTVETLFDSKEAAVNYVDELVGEEEDGRNEETGIGPVVNKVARYSVVAIHCAQSKVPDGVVISVDEDGTVTETPEPTTTEPKVPEKAEDFADVKADDWFAEELTALVEKGIFKGVLDTEKNEYNFEPKTEMNTETLVVLIARVMDAGVKDGEGAAWAEPAVKWASEEGLTEGVETGKITRADVALVLWRAAGKPEPSAETTLDAFEDVAELDGDALTAMKWAYEVSIFKGDAAAPTMRPAGVINRAEMVAVIARFDKVVNAD